MENEAGSDESGRRAAPGFHSPRTERGRLEVNQRGPFNHYVETKAGAKWRRRGPRFPARYGKTETQKSFVQNWSTVRRTLSPPSGPKALSPRLQNAWAKSMPNFCPLTGKDIYVAYVQSILKPSKISVWMVWLMRVLVSGLRLWQRAVLKKKKKTREKRKNNSEW